MRYYVRKEKIYWRAHMKVAFDESLVTGNEMIDGQHKELIDKIDKLLVCCEEGGGKVQAIKMLD